MKSNFSEKKYLVLLLMRKTLLSKDPMRFWTFFSTSRSLLKSTVLPRQGEVYSGSNGCGMFFWGHRRKAGGFSRCSSMLPGLVTLQILRVATRFVFVQE